MSEINSIANGTYVIGQTSATNFQAGPGISITQPSEGTIRIANDETVLWENSEGANSGTLSENALNFKTVEIYGGTNDGEQWYTRVIPNLFNGWGTVPLYHTTTNGEIWFKGGRVRIDGTTFKIENVRERANTNITGSWAVIDDNTLKIPVIRIVGLNRISGSNA